MNEHGYTVRVPRLPGHGRNWQDLNRTQWQEWPEKVEAELELLKKDRSRILLWTIHGRGNHSERCSQT
jgi:carboxylesterase